MTLYEIINPSDPYTVECDDLEIAALACVLLGQGHYEFKAKDGSEDVPFFMFGGHDEWFREHFSRTLKESLEAADLTRIAACLDTVTLQAKRVSSLNDIGERAKILAAALRGKEVASCSRWAWAPSSAG